MAIIMSSAALVSATAANAQLGGFLNVMKTAVQQAQQQKAQPPKPAEPAAEKQVAQPQETAPTEVADEGEDDPMRHDDQMVQQSGQLLFSCITGTGRKIKITTTHNGISYVYGVKGAKPELSFVAQGDEVTKTISQGFMDDEKYDPDEDRVGGYSYELRMTHMGKIYAVIQNNYGGAHQVQDDRIAIKSIAGKAIASSQCKDGSSDGDIRLANVKWLNDKGQVTTKPDPFQ